MPVVPDGKRYSPLDRDAVHADMRIAPEQTRRAIAMQRGVAAAHRDCAVCAELNPRTAGQVSRRAKIVFDLLEVAALAGLPPSARPTRMYVGDDPHLLHLVFEDAELDPVPIDQEAPYAELNRDTVDDIA